MTLLRTTADAAFSDCIRERASWSCEICGSVPDRRGLHCAHFMSRGHWSTRFNPANAASFCWHHHRESERNRDTVLIPWIKSTRGEIVWDTVFADAMRPAKGIRKMVPAIAAHYRSELRRMRELREAGVVGWIEIQPWEWHPIRKPLRPILSALEG